MSAKRPTDPLGVAVALHYDGTSAPRVVAKGRGELAGRIVTKAHEHDVPLHTDPHLASVLARIPLGEEIPPELYVAVAEVIAFAYWLGGTRTTDNHRTDQKSGQDPLPEALSD